jgi:Cupin superfamily protein
MSDESSLPPSPLAALIAPTTLAEFEERYWEREPLFLPRDELPSAFADLLRTDDVAELSERMAALEVEPQIMRNGERCQPRELLWDFLDGGSAIINRIDRLWPPIGRLCSALRADFLHVFAVMYLTPRDSRAVPAHTDDQDVFILQLAGRKAWTVYGSPIELPCTHEQLGKTERALAVGERAARAHSHGRAGAGLPALPAARLRARGALHEGRRQLAARHAHRPNVRPQLANVLTRWPRRAAAHQRGGTVRAAARRGSRRL